MLYPKTSYIKFSALFGLLRQLENKLQNIIIDNFIEHFLSYNDTNNGEIWIYENKSTNSGPLCNSDYLNPSNLWYGSGQYLYSKIYYVEDNFELSIRPDIFADFIEGLKKLPGILRVNFFALNNIGILPHKDTDEAYPGYHTFVYFINAPLSSKFILDTIDKNLVQEKCFFHDANAVHSASVEETNWWYIVTIDIKENFLYVTN